MFKVPDGLEVEIPEFYRITQKFDPDKIENVEKAVVDELRKPEIKDSLKPGNKIAVAVGSRGVACIAEIVQALVGELKKMGCEPFIVPSMGSHGNAEAENQKAILEGYGIKEEYVGAPIRSSLEVVKLGEVDGGVSVYFDKIAMEADGIIPVNRVKPHTDYVGDIESGIMKIMVIGLGNHKGATSIHYRGAMGLKNIIPRAARLIIGKAPIIFGLATVENSYDYPCRIKAILPESIENEEKKLLEIAKEKLPTFPVNDIDLLIVNEIGKNISGTGMDTNITGRIGIWGIPDPIEPDIKKIVVLNLSEHTGGNAVGIGLADVTTKSVVDKIDFGPTYTNAIAGNCFQRSFTPIVAPSDHDAIALGLKYSRGWDPVNARVIRIKNTLHLEDLEVSSSIWQEVKGNSNIDTLNGPYKWDFNSEGGFV